MRYLTCPATRAAGLGLALAAGLAASGRADIVDIPQGVGSADRPRPEYDPIGVHSGGLYVYPNLQLEADYDDNIFADKTGKRGDMVFHIHPEINVKSDWSRHAIKLNVYGERQLLGKYKSENTTTYGANALGQLELGSWTSITLTASGDKQAEDRSNVDANHTSAHPIRYTVLGTGLTVIHTLNRFILTGDVKFSKLNYNNATTEAGRFLSQDYRDYNRLTGTFRGSYLFSPGYRALIQVAANQSRYRLHPGDPGASPFDRNSKGYRAEAGLDFELTELLYGNIRAGYLTQNYSDPRLKDVKGFSAGANLLYNLTTLTSIRLTGDRRVENVSDTQTAGRLVTEVTLGVDHELLRNLILTIDTSKSWLNYSGSGRKDKETSAGFQAMYLMNRGLTVQFNYLLQKRTSSLPLEGFTANGVGLQLKLSL